MPRTCCWLEAARDAASRLCSLAAASANAASCRCARPRHLATCRERAGSGRKFQWYASPVMNLAIHDGGIFIQKTMPLQFGLLSKQHLSRPAPPSPHLLLHCRPLAPSCGQLVPQGRHLALQRLCCRAVLRYHSIQLPHSCLHPSAAGWRRCT